MSIALGNSLSKGGMTGPTIITDGLILKHNYDAGAVVPVSDGAAYFDGTDDYIVLSGTYNNTSHSISAWIWVVDDADQKTIFDYRDANNDGIHLYVSTTEQLVYQINTEDGLYAPVDLENKWHHVVATNDGTTSKIYLNGALVETADTSGQTISTSAEARIGGRSHTSPSNYYQGYICNVGFWSSALTQAQVKSIMWKNYANLTSSEKTNLVSWWNLSADANDSHGSNNGTLT
jgi:hypothetical protein